MKEYEECQYNDMSADFQGAGERTAVKSSFDQHPTFHENT
jgi:hypothetical protein